MISTCYRCGNPGHVRSECPSVPPPPVSAPARAGAHPYDTAVPARKPPAEVAYYPAAAAMARELLGAGRVTRESVVRTPFRDQYGMQLRTEPELREMALADVAVSRAARLVQS